MAGHGGNRESLAEKCACQVEELIDFSANINPLGPPDSIRGVISRNVSQLIHYPDPSSRKLIGAISRSTQQNSNTIVVGNGTSELLFAITNTVRAKRALIPVPSYIDYATACKAAGLAVQYFYLLEENNFYLDCEALKKVLLPGDLVIIGQPNNPTGRLVDRENLISLAIDHPDITFLVDEAFAGFVNGYKSLAGCVQNLVVLCSLTKLYAIPGLRLGYLVAHEEICSKIFRYIPPWSVNTLAQEVGKSLFKESQYVDASCQYVQINRPLFQARLQNIQHLTVFDSDANFLLIKSEHPDLDGPKIAQHLLEKAKIAIRVCDNYEGLDRKYFRLALRTEAEQDQLLNVLEDLLGVIKVTKVPCTKKKKTPAIMFLGTGSDVGKSVLVAALCRVLLQDGVRVAPFKAQNMSLNSYVTRDGGEMGRAQVVQAQACRLDPDVRMNPVLLKPSSDVGSQVIVNGKVAGNMDVTNYIQFKAKILEQVHKSYDQLALDFDALVLEGAGSPGEVNLKSHDIVNMRMAQYADAKVLLAGDIDRGGVYASFIGHLEVMSEWERDLLAGFMVNRFRGDASLLDDAHRYIYDRTGYPILGVIPFLNDLGLPQEDSVSFKAGLCNTKKPAGAHVEIAVIDVPHISNFTDVEPFLYEPDVWLRIIKKPDELGLPDAILLPGSKNVIKDLQFLEQSGLVDKIKELVASGCEIVGICGGFQILGSVISDPHCIEDKYGGQVRGLDLLPIKTQLAPEKTLTRKEGVHVLSGRKVSGYEIHHGLSQGDGENVLCFDDGSRCGFSTENGQVWGSYLHGIFDADGYRRYFIDSLRQRKGLAAYAGEKTCFDLEPALDRLAGVFRKNVDMKVIYQILGL